MSAESGVWQRLAEPGVQGRAGGDLSSGWNVIKDTEAPGGLGIPVCAWTQSQSTAACPSTGRGEQERALPSQTCTPAGPSIFTYGLQDKRDIFRVPAVSEPHPIHHHCPPPSDPDPCSVCICVQSEMLGLDFVTSSLSTQCQEGTPTVCVWWWGGGQEMASQAYQAEDVAQGSGKGSPYWMSPFQTSRQTSWPCAPTLPCQRVSGGSHVSHPLPVDHTAGSSTPRP